MNFFIGCDSLHTLKLSYNRFFGQIFPKPTGFKGLVVLIANNNLFIGIEDGLRNLTSLGVLDLSNNYLQGVIPSWFGSGTFFSSIFSFQIIFLKVPCQALFLTYLPLSFWTSVETSLQGTCLRISMVSILYFNDNEFSGTIPSTLIKDVLVLDLQNNKLSGTIPPFVNNQSIFSLLLRGNALTGQIPTDLCGLRSIRILDLSKNWLNGSIPLCLNNILFGRSTEYDDNGYIEAFGPGDTRPEVYSRLLVLPSEFSPEYTSYLRFIVEFASKSRYDTLQKVWSLCLGWICPVMNSAVKSQKSWGIFRGYVRWICLKIICQV